MQMFVNFPSWISPQVVPFLPIRWYAVMYLFAFATCYIVVRYRCTRGALNSMSVDDTLSMFIYIIGFLLLGARLFSTLFYEGSWYYWTHPWMIFWPFRNGVFVGLPGMSYHGGAVGGILGAILFCRKYHYRFFDVADLAVSGIPIGYTFGRLGNFINGELWGRVTTSRIGMVFPDAPRFSTNIQWVRDVADKVGIPYTAGSYVNLPRHPSQLYEALFEGIILWLFIWFIIKPISEKRKEKNGPGLITGSYFAGYGLVRFVIEYFREPDSQLGFIIKLGKESEPTALFKSVLNISMGQILCFMMIIGGIAVVIYALRSKPVLPPKKAKGKHNGHK